MPVPFDIGPFEIADTEIRASAAAGSAVVVFAGNGSDALRYDVIQLEGLRVAPAAAAADVSGPYGVRGTVRIEAALSDGRVATSELRVAELRAGWEAPDGYGGVGMGRIHVPLSSDRRDETEGMALSFRPLLSQLGSAPLHAPGVDARIAWPDRVQVQGGVVWTAPSASAPMTWARLDLLPLGPMPDDEDGHTDKLRIDAGGAIADQRDHVGGPETWLVGDVSAAWRSFGGEVGWISRNHAGTISDDQWIALHARLAPLPVHTDLFFAGRVEWIDGIVAGEFARNQATGRLSWRALQPDADFGDGADRAWAALYVEGTVSRESGAGNEPTTGDALTLDHERPNDWLAVGVWTRW
ncbi:MAG: hypothetical protein R3F59_02705 [Myxococcota bacterium]